MKETLVKTFSRLLEPPLQTFTQSSPTGSLSVCQISVLLHTRRRKHHFLHLLARSVRNYGSQGQRDLGGVHISCVSRSVPCPSPLSVDAIYVERLCRILGQTFNSGEGVVLEAPCAAASLPTSGSSTHAIQPNSSLFASASCLSLENIS